VVCATRGLLAAVLVLGIQTSAGAATILKLEVIADGSVDPPGDVVAVSLLLFPGEGGIALELRAFVRNAGADGNVAAVAANDQMHRDEKGRWLKRVVLERPKEGHALDARIVVPFASLKLAPGRYELAYELRGVRDGSTQFARATPMTPLVVSTLTRTKTSQRDEIDSVRPQREMRKAYVIKDGKAIAQDVEIETDVTEVRHEKRSMKVEIPGEFSRPAAVHTRGDAPPDETGIQSSARALDGKPWASLAESTGKPKRVIFYATNRAVIPAAAAGAPRFGTEAGPQVTYGSCLVNIPVEHHTRGEIELPSYWWQSRDPRKYFLIEALDTLGLDTFLQTLRADDVLLFVHGYNTSFDDAVLRTAQLVHDLGFPGKGVTFSWPSQGALDGYAHDEAQNAQSTAALVEVLTQLTRADGRSAKTRKIHVIVHSMGNRLFLQAARQFELEQNKTDARRIFGHVALAAPDVDATTFSALVPGVIRQSASTTLYYCQYDRALLASRTLHMDKPVGLGPFFAEGLDTINADQVNTSFLGHGYFASAHPILIDLQLTILYNQKPDGRRPPLGHFSKILGYPHWALLDLTRLGASAGR
jgi:esterase/lipase superfamily enzyme